LRALASLGIFAADPHGRFHLNRLAQTLRSDHPESLRDFALMLVDDYNWFSMGRARARRENGQFRIRARSRRACIPLDAAASREGEDVLRVHVRASRSWRMPL